MEKYLVTLVLIIGYDKMEEPILRSDEYTVEAESEEEAIRIAKILDQTSYSIYESYTERI